MRLTKEDIQRFMRKEERSDYYRNILEKFERESGELSEDAVREFISGYGNKNSRNTVLAVIKSVSKHLHDKIPPVEKEDMMRRFELERVMGIRGARVVTRLEQKELSMENLRTIYESTQGAEFSGLWCLGWFGCRPGELVEQTLDAINKKPDRYLPEDLARSLGPDEYCIKFLTKKTVVERACFMDGFTKDHLENFIKSGRGYPFLRRSCVQLREKVGVRLTPKWFRSTLQTKLQRKLAESGVPLVRIDLLVKVISGHTVKQDITSVYTSFGSDIKRAMLDFHPLKPLEEEFN